MHTRGAPNPVGVSKREFLFLAPESACHLETSVSQPLLIRLCGVEGGNAQGTVRSDDFNYILNTT